MLTRYTGINMIENSYLSPSSQNNFKKFSGLDSLGGFCPTFIIAGGAEMLLDECKDLHKQFLNCGVRSTFHEVENGVHDNAYVQYY